MKNEKSILTYYILTVLVVLITVVLVYYIWAMNRSFVPQNFKESRIQSATIASELVSTLDESLKSLDKINEEDRNYRYSSALELVNQEADNVDKAKAEALELSNELIKMSQSAEGIKPANARNLALEAIAQETPLLNHLVNYNSYFGSLLETLRQKFIGDADYSGNEVQIWINNMNREAGDINILNDSFGQKLKDFDAAIK